MKKVAFFMPDTKTEHDTCLDKMEHSPKKVDVPIIGTEVDSQEVKTKVGQVVREVRKRRGLTLVELSEASTVSVSHLSEIEKGKRIPSIIVLKKIAKVLKVAVYYLLYKDLNIEDIPMEMRDKFEKFNETIDLLMEEIYF
ncbi:helix-turn-helix transcriptional regulator [Prolixibacteraceae bacterium Z1-6]|uniref:Helix-turn-helix transcriptional regulator n=1 Tax=Draconibacterium aestuarii TaxID=2998507 RepID=A0A9X3F222_9BACT|nr:helix-turn-helix transcriptional regulator [Prolixibacteraceae bacterium Z1-6]